MSESGMSGVGLCAVPPARKSVSDHCTDCGIDEADHYGIQFARASHCLAIWQAQS